MQTAGGLIGFVAEFSARVQGRQNNFQRRLAGKFRVIVDRDAAPVVADGDIVVCIQTDFNPVSVSGHGLVHRVVENFADKMVQGALVRAADIHAGAAADRFKTLKNLNVGGIVGVCFSRFCGTE